MHDLSDEERRRRRPPPVADLLWSDDICAHGRVLACAECAEEAKNAEQQSGSSTAQSLKEVE